VSTPHHTARRKLLRLLDLHRLRHLIVQQSTAQSAPDPQKFFQTVENWTLSNRRRGETIWGAGKGGGLRHP
jgi:hypothetical protein